MDAPERRERETDEASRWWVRLGTAAPDTVSPEDRRAFTHWLRESPVNVAEILRIAHVHEALGRFKLWTQISVDPMPGGQNIIPMDPPPGRSPHGRGRSGKARFFALAAVAAAVLLTLSALLPQWRGTVIATDLAERREVMLADGSVVKLDPETTLRVCLDARERHVTLQRGRALFRVAKDPNRPFWVEANQTVVRAVGTAFGIERRSQSVVVTVSEGKVTVGEGQERAQPRQGRGHDIPVARQEAVPIVLMAGQQVTVRNGGSAAPVRQVDPGRALAWTEGHLVFDSAPLSEVVEEFNRYNHVRLRVSDRQLLRRPISGVFEAGDPETLIAFIRVGAHVTVSREGQDILIDAAGNPN